jgi:ligand-binding sensor domain-containing protein
MNRNMLNPFVTVLCAGMLVQQSAISQPGSWVQTAGPAGGNVTALVVTQSGSVLAGTEEGVLRSTDGGASWIWSSTNMTYRSVSNFARDSSGGVLAATGAGSIYRSTNDGVSWQGIPGPEAGSIYGLCCRDTATLWVSAWGGGVRRTTDHGVHWQALDSGLTNKYVLSLLVENGGFALAGTVTGAFRTTNGGVVWDSAAHGLSGASVYSLARHGSGDLFAATSLGTFRSTNNGDIWTKADALPARSLVTDTTGLIIAGTFSGQSRRTTDGGTVWNSAPVSPTQTIVTLACSPSGAVYAGSGGMGVYRSTDKGGAWSPRRDGFVASIVTALLRAPDNSIYAATDGSGLFRTTDGGASWTIVPTTPDTYKFYSLAVDDSGKILAGTWGYGILRQPGTDPSWNPMVYGYFFCVATSPGGVILAGNDVGKVLHSTDYGKTWATDSVTDQGVFSVADGGDGFLYAGSNQKGVYRSSNSGKTWIQRNTGLANLSVRGFLVRQGGLLFACTDGGLFKTTDRGESWSSVVTGLTSLRSLLPIGANRIVAVGWKGVSFSPDGGTSWGLVNDGLWPADVRSIAIDAGGYLYAGLANAGVFKSVAATAVDGDIQPPVPAGCGLWQNYPNPFNASTIIGYTIAGTRHEALGTSWVNLSVYDMLGREVAVLVNEKKDAGAHEVRFDASDFASGIYFYRLNAGGFIQSKKFVLLR